MKKPVILFAGLPINSISNDETGRDDCLYPYLLALRDLQKYYKIFLFADIATLTPAEIDLYLIFNYDRYTYRALFNFDKSFNLRALLIRLETPLFAPILWDQNFTDNFLHVLSFSPFNLNKETYTYIGYPQVILNNNIDDTNNSIALISGNNIIPYSKYLQFSLLGLRTMLIDSALNNNFDIEIALFGKNWNLEPYNKLMTSFRQYSRLLRRMPSKYNSLSSWADLYKGPLASKSHLSSKFGAIYCPENSLIDSYFSEKLIDCLNIGRIPIYSGYICLKYFLPNHHNVIYILDFYHIL